MHPLTKIVLPVFVLLVAWIVMSYTWLITSNTQEQRCKDVGMTYVMESPTKGYCL